MGLEIEIYEPFEENFRKKLTAFSNETVLISGHSNTIPALVNHLINDDNYSQLEENEYSKIFVVTMTQGQSSHYILKY